MPKYMSFEQCSEEAKAVIEAYFRAEYAGLLSFARKLNLDENLAEEAVQETFVIFMRNYEQWKTRKLGSGWLYGVLKNIAMHILRDENEIKLRCMSLEDVVYEPGMEEPGYLFVQQPPDGPDLRLLKRFYVDGMQMLDFHSTDTSRVQVMKFLRRKLHNIGNIVLFYHNQLRSMFSYSVYCSGLVNFLCAASQSCAKTSAAEPGQDLTVDSLPQP